MKKGMLVVFVVALLHIVNACNSTASDSTLWRRVDSLTTLVSRLSDSLEGARLQLKNWSAGAPVQLTLQDSLIFGDAVLSFRDSVLLKAVQERFYWIKNDPELWLSWHVRLGRYEELIRSVLRENGVPEIFIGLFIWESRLNSDAKSRAKAVGIPQFIPFTGQAYGLRINSIVDERLNPYISLPAAAKHLVDLKDSLGSWLLAIAAYNCGEPQLKRRIAKQGTRDVFLLEKPTETNGYMYWVPATMFWYQKRYELYPWLQVVPQYEEYPEATIREMKLRKLTSLEDIAVSYGLSLKEFKRVNRHFLVQRVPKGTYRVVIPEPESLGQD